MTLDCHFFWGVSYRYIYIYACVQLVENSYSVALHGTGELTGDQQ